VRRGAVVLLAGALLGVGGYLLLQVVAGPEKSPGPAAVDVSATDVEWSYVIPAGTGSRLDRGEEVEILPARIDARVGEVIRIVNADDRGYLLGPFYVGPDETLTQRFTAPGTFKGECAVHPSGQLLLVVES
jgi:hypothetical protein